VLKTSSSSDKPTSGELPQSNGRDTTVEFEPSSVCLDKMVQNFIEESNEKSAPATTKCGCNRCNCFKGNNNNNYEEFDIFDKYNKVYKRRDDLKNIVTKIALAQT